jgi:hypothetical protein
MYSAEGRRGSALFCRGHQVGWRMERRPARRAAAGRRRRRRRGERTAVPVDPGGRLRRLHRVRDTPQATGTAGDVGVVPDAARCREHHRRNPAADIESGPVAPREAGRIRSIESTRPSSAVRIPSDEPLHEGECGLRDLAPAAVDGQRMATAAHLHELSGFCLSRCCLYEAFASGSGHDSHR